MLCPQCGGTSTRVIDSRSSLTTGVRRRRVCMTCAYRWSTHEQVAPPKRKRGSPTKNVLVDRAGLPVNAHRAIQWFFLQKEKQNVSYQELGKQALLSPRVMMEWRHHNPRIDNLEAALNVLGWSLTVRRKR